MHGDQADRLAYREFSYVLKPVLFLIDEGVALKDAC